MQSQSRKFKIRQKTQATKLNAFKDRQNELEHQIAVQESSIEEKKRALQIVIDQKEARRQILKKQRELAESEVVMSRNKEVEPISNQSHFLISPTEEQCDSPGLNKSLDVTKP